MISIDRVYKTLLTLANSDIRGNITPSELKLVVNNVVNEIYEEYFFEINKLVNKENRGLINGGLENIPDRYREKLQHFLSSTLITNISGFYGLPNNYRYIDSIYTDDNERVEECKSAQEFKTVASFSHTNKLPIYLKTDGRIQVAPLTIITDLNCFYLRNPNQANWTFTVVNGAELYDPSKPDFANIDLHPSEENNVIMKVLKQFGINLKEQDLVTITQNEDTINANQENLN